MMSGTDPDSGAVVLASASPRRRELLAAYGLEPVVRPVDVDETAHPGETPRDYVERLAVAKAEAAAADAPGAVVIGADTAVALDGEIYGKPASATDFRRMMGALGGRAHEVYTGVAVVQGGRTAVRTAVSRVRLRQLDEREMRQYWASGEPRDKAGGYAIQGLGALFVSGLEGSYSGVVGLPLYETGELLAAAGVDLLALAMPDGVRESDG
ncbi:Maf family protein [Lentisalinibacter salinarum]|uniref:Maf family protein n=1 Tax=Lentisalinibacter salinarum TaxID=2992239 RepID=UPI00386B4FA2